MGIKMGFKIDINSSPVWLEFVRTFLVEMSKIKQDNGYVKNCRAVAG